MSRFLTSKKVTIGLSIALVLALTALVWVLWQNYWWRRSVDYTADEAGTAQAMSAFRNGRLVLWEINPTNDFPQFSGKYDGPYEIWYDEYHPDMPSPWHYMQRRLDEANNAKMRGMYERSLKSKAGAESHSISTNSLSQ